MKPLFLTMTAFGPYLDKTEVDFKSLGEGIYVIAGPTGAGKTTIFDAVMFALFEEVSAKPGGSEKGSTRDKSMVHSDYASKDTQTVVTLRFEESGRQFTVKRTVRFSKKRGGGWNDAKYDAELEGSGIHATGSSHVTEEVERILHMDAAQFRQIVMLAQGEFRAFMEAKDDRRKEILGELFDSEPYRVFQKRLKDAADELAQRCRTQQERVQNVLHADTFLLPPELSESERARYAPEHPELETNLRALVAADDEARHGLEARQAEEKQQDNAWRERRGRAAAENARYEELRQLLAHREALEKQREEMAQMERETAETATAWHVVVPAEQSFRSADAALRSAESARETLKTALSAAAEESARNQREWEEGEPQRQSELASLRAELQRIEEALPKLDELAQTRQQLKEQQRLADTAAHARDAALQRRQNCEMRLKETEEELAALTGIEETAAAAAREQETAEEQLHRLTEPKKGLIDTAAALRDREARVKALLIASQDAAQEASAAAALYDEVHRRYLSGYAGILGLALAEELEQNGEAACPVCGSRYLRGEKHSFAAPEQDTPDEATLKRAERQRDDMQRKARKADSDFSAEQAAFSSDRDALLLRLEELVPADWRWSYDLMQQLDETAARLRRRSEEIARRADEARRRMECKHSLSAEHENCLTERESARDVWAENDKRCSNTALQIGHLTDMLGRLQAELAAASLDAYTDRAAAEQAVQQKRARESLLETQSKRAADILAAAREKETALRARLASRSEAAAEATAARDTAAAVFAETLSKAGFPDEARFAAARARVGTADAERWLQQRRQQSNAWHNDCANTADKIEKLQQESPVYTDLTALDAELSTLERAMAETDAALRELHLRSASHTAALKTVCEVSAALRPLKLAHARLAGLADLANGSAGEGGRRAFDGYVLSSTFREVLSHASRYLTEMTGGKYELVHDTEAVSARKNASADFRIQVQDTLTGEQREIGSLSGGEGFQASVALALGLSDTVQSHVSTVKIDTMFIDEGFGSLDADALHQMLAVLGSLSGGRRQIGIISHIDALEETADKFIRVKPSRDKTGSSLRLEL